VSLSANRGIALPIVRAAAFLGARRSLNQLEILPDFGVISLVGDHIDKSPAGAPLGFVHQRLQFLFAELSIRSLRGELLAVVKIILGGIGPRAPGENSSFWLRIRGQRRGYERPPSLAEGANISQDLLALFLGHFALRIRQLIEALLDFRPKLSATDFAVLL
jgi:hypothetical protein